METLEVKPRFRFRHRMAGRYWWEPVNMAAMALSATAESTAVSRFWGGDTNGVEVTTRAHARAGELGMNPEQYRQYVRGLAVKSRALAAEARELQLAMHPITAEEMAEHFPELVPAPVPAMDVAEWLELHGTAPKPSRLRRIFNRKARS